MDRITAKFGGTSLADAAHFRRVREILAGNLARRFVVVSAPGKRSGQDAKITDLLYDCHQAARAGGDVASAFAPVEVRFREILAGLNLNLDLSEEFRATQWAMERGAGQAFCVSRGEYFSGRIMAALLGLPFIDPAQCVFFDEHGQFDGEAAQRTLQEKLQGLPGAVMPGFYGGMPDGAVATFARGGSDISGAILARASGSAVYENWTDVSGVLAADPRVVENPAPIGCMTYTEVRELAYLGATVLHEDAIYPAKVAGIPIHICNTMAPNWCDLSGLADIPNKPPILWIRGEQDLMVSDTSACDLAFLGKAGLVPGYPGEEVCPPQPMLSQTRFVLDKYSANGGSYHEAVIPGGHGCMLDHEDEFIYELRSFF